MATKTYVPIELRSYQMDPYNKMEGAMSQMGAIMLAAPTGAGKTIAGLKLGQKYDFTIFVIGPAGIEDNWKEEAAKYKMELIFISYTLLAGKSGKMSHNYLQYTNGEYVPTQQYKDLVSKRILLIFDECQAGKKTTAKCSQACYALSKEVRLQNCGSRILLMSATPFDKEEFAESAFKLMGIIKKKELMFYNVGTNEYEMEGYGFEEAVQYCNLINKTLMNNLYPSKINAKTLRLTLYQMYVQIVKTRAIFTLPKPPSKSKFIPEAKYYNLSNENERMVVVEAINKLSGIVRNEQGEVKITATNMGAITKAFMEIESCKVGLFERVAKSILENTINDKVIIYLWHDESVIRLMNALSKYNPLRCDGKVTKKKRTANRLLFQQPNNMYRVIIAKPTAFGVGINLDDRDGNFPRHTLINPSYHFDKIHQAAGRTFRPVTTMSDSYCTLMYIKDTEESSIIHSLERKSDVVRSIVSYATDDIDELISGETETDKDEDVTNETIFPSDYPIVMEN